MRFATLTIVALSLAVAQAAIPAHEITSLPGFNGTLPSKQYSGYLSVDEAHGRYLHYWFVESENDPANDPVVLWMNGGPGCSSLDGYFYEQGPLHFVQQPTEHPLPGLPKLKLNPYRWNKVANMIFLEAPAGVGFSYSNTPSDYNTNDNKTADDNWRFLEAFFSNYSEYAKNDFYITGESYAGIYVPTLANKIRVENQAGSSNINLKGFMVGNGCIGNSVGACSAQGTKIGVDFLFGHGLYSQKLHTQILNTCQDYENPSSACYNLLTQMGTEVGFVNVYDIYYKCVLGDDGLPQNRKGDQMWRIPRRAIDEAMSVGGPVGCIGGVLASKYLNTPEVRKALHVLDMDQLPQWSICTGSINYDSNIVSLLPLYPTLIKDYRVTIYNGDVDACVPYVGNEHWTSSLGIPVKEGWRQWTIEGQVGGYVTSYDSNGFTFITVKGSGHMVPQFQPAPALQMFTRFIRDQPY